MLKMRFGFVADILIKVIENKTTQVESLIE
jgi:hypothetical protein